MNISTYITPSETVYGRVDEEGFIDLLNDLSEDDWRDIANYTDYKDKPKGKTALRNMLIIVQGILDGFEDQED